MALVEDKTIFGKNPRLATVVGFFVACDDVDSQNHSVMNKPSTAKNKKSTPPRAKAELGPLMPGRDILVEALEREGVEVIFAYPGGASMEIHQALTRSKKIRTVLPRHEQGGAFAAEGYGRATGRAGVRKTS